MVFINDECALVVDDSCPIMAYTDTFTSANAVPMQANNTLMNQKLAIEGVSVQATATNANPSSIESL